jgi:peroxiredoxin
LRDSHHLIEEAGAELVLVGTGAPHFAKAFREEFAQGLRVLSDPELKSYSAAGFHRSLARLFNPKVAFKFARAYKDGHRIGRIMGDASQFGGTFVIRKGGEVAFSHSSEDIFDRPAVEDVLAALG